jgi:prephenate dehydrogenase
MQTVAIVGVGLIGASFGLALRSAGFEGEIVGVSSRAALDEARTVGAISSSASLEEACRVANVIYVSQTVDRILHTLTVIRKHLRTDVLVTDAGSTKVVITRAAAACLPDICFVGGHPLAGKESRGAASADANLFRNRTYILTPVQGPASPYLPEFRELLKGMGAVMAELTPETHDEAVAFTSHLPQLLSTALAGTLAAEGNPHLRELFGPGLTDMTRLALSSPDLWSAILAQNRESVLVALDAFLRQFTAVREAVARCDVGRSFEAGRTFATAIRVKNP